MRHLETKLFNISTRTEALAQFRYSICSLLHEQNMKVKFLGGGPLAHEWTVEDSSKNWLVSSIFSLCEALQTMSLTLAPFQRIANNIQNRMLLYIDNGKHTVLTEITKLATIVEGEPKATFSIPTTPRCKGGRYSIPWIAPLYPWSLPYSAEC